VVRGKSIDEIPVVTAKTGDNFVVSITALVKPQSPHKNHDGRNLPGAPPKLSSPAKE
jgi:hypothetical protein